MALVILKLTITPLVIGGVSVAIRRWGPVLGGLLIALPLTSGPVIFFLALDHGTAFASAAATGSLAGCIPIVGFALAYGLAARRTPWPPALGAGVVGWLVPALAVQAASELPLPVLVVLVVVVVGAGLRLVPRPSVVPRAVSAQPGISRSGWSSSPPSSSP